MLKIEVNKKMFLWLKNKFATKKKSENDYIYVMGNSHTRAFSFNRNFFPLFLGPGKTHCFISDESLELLKSSFSKALKKISGRKIMLVLGEPDARYYLGKGWYPWENQRFFDVKDFRTHIDQSFERYKKLINFLKEDFKNQYLVLNVTPVEDDSQNKIVNYFNDLLRNYCEKENLVFIDINNELYLSSIKISPIFLGDQIHLNNQIQVFVENFLLEKNLIQERGYQEKVVWDHIDVKDQYVYSKEFGCYVLKS